MLEEVKKLQQAHTTNPQVADLNVEPESNVAPEEAQRKSALEEAPKIPTSGKRKRKRPDDADILGGRSAIAEFEDAHTKEVDKAEKPKKKEADRSVQTKMQALEVQDCKTGASPSSVHNYEVGDQVEVQPQTHHHFCSSEDRIYKLAMWSVHVQPLLAAVFWLCGICGAQKGHEATSTFHWRHILSQICIFEEGSWIIWRRSMKPSANHDLQYDWYWSHMFADHDQCRGFWGGLVSLWNLILNCWVLPTRLHLFWSTSSWRHRAVLPHISPHVCLS